MLQQVLEALPVPGYLTNAEGDLTYFNEAAAAFWGWRPKLGEQRWCGSWRLRTLDGQVLAHEDCPMAVAIKEQRPVRGAVAIAERPNGEQVQFTPFPTPLRDKAGAMIGAVNFLIEISERDRRAAIDRVMLEVSNMRMTETLAAIQALAAQSIADANSLVAAAAVPIEPGPSAEIIPLHPQPR